jgi:hypothetical protein
MTTWKAAPIRLSVEPPVLSAGRLVLSWSARSLSGRRLYLFDRLFEVDRAGNRTVDPNLVYSRVEGDLLVLSKLLPEIPEGCRVEIPEVPFLARLEPDQTFEERIEIPLPVAESHPYMEGRIANRKPRLVVTERVAFVVGWFEPGTPDPVREVALGGAVELSVDYDAAHPSAASLVAGPFPFRCEVLSRTAGEDVPAAKRG